MARWSVLIALTGILGVACEANYNPLPSAPMVEIDPYYPTTADDLVSTIAIESSDADFDPIIYRYQWFLDDQPRADLRGTWVSFTETERGDRWKLQVIPWDGEGEGAPYETSVTVVNAPPTCEVGIIPDAPLSTDDLEVDVFTHDLDGDEVTVSYVWNLEGSDASHEGDTLPADMTARGDRWIVTATPDDSFDAGETATAAVDIENQAPIVTSVVLGPDNASRDDTLLAEVIAEDPDDDDFTLIYTWRVDGAMVQEGESEQLEPSLFRRGERVTVTVTANDGFVDGAPVVSNQLIIDNALPVITEVLLTPDEVYEESYLNCEVNGWSDADNDTEGYRYEWRVNAIPIAATGANLDGEWFDRADSVYCTATPFDGLDEGEPITSNEVLVDNTAPEILSTSLNTTAPYTDDSLSVSVATTDADGDNVSLSYAWYVEGALVGSSATLGGDSFSKTQTVYVVVTPSDDATSGASVTSEVATVVNTIPQITSVSLSPSEVYTNDTITATVATYDVDGDSVDVDYLWTVDGGALSETSSTLSGVDRFSKHELIQVTVTPNDGDEDGHAVTSATLTVLNSTPEAPVVAIDPPDPAEGDDLICEVDVEAADEDLDTIDYSFLWTRDGVAFTTTTTTDLTGDTVLADHTSSGEVWQCTATPNDGEIDGPTHSDEVTICPPGTERDCPAISCAEVLSALPTAADGEYWLDPTGAGPFEAYCDMSTDGGGWTLLAVVSDDGEDTWTWTDRHYWDTDSSTFGDLDHLDEDFKSRAYHQVVFTDLLFVHAPSGDWAAYAEVADGAEDMGEYIDWWDGTHCWAAGDGYEMSAGSISAFHDLCSTQLFFNAEDHDGNATCGCADCEDHAYGPSWSAISTAGCPFDDPASSGGLGPQPNDTRAESDNLGFADALGLNTGAAGSGENNMRIYCR
jgi:hypothetical protein